MENKGTSAREMALFKSIVLALYNALGVKDAEIARKDAEIARKDAEIQQLREENRQLREEVKRLGEEVTRLRQIVQESAPPFPIKERPRHSNEHHFNLRDTIDEGIDRNKAELVQQKLKS